MGKMISIKDNTLFEVATDDEINKVHLCTIENTGRDKYEIFDVEDCMLEIGTIDTTDVIELMLTGRLERSHIYIKPLK